MSEETIKHLEERIQDLEKQLEDRLTAHDEHLTKISIEMKKSIKILMDDFNSAAVPECCKVCMRCGKMEGVNCELRKRYNK